MSNIVWHAHAVDKQSRAEQKGQKPLVIWFTGLSGAGKSTLAGALEQALAASASASTPICWMGTMCATACAAIWASMTPPVRRISAGSAKWQN